MVGTDVPVKELLKTIPKYKVMHCLIRVESQMHEIISQPAIVTKKLEGNPLFLDGSVLSCFGRIITVQEDLIRPHGLYPRLCGPVEVYKSGTIPVLHL